MRAALLLLASLATIALQANACDIKGPIDILADKVCSWNGECPGKLVCLKCVKKIFKNEGECEYVTVQFPPELQECTNAVQDKCFADKLNELCVDQYVDKIESMLEQIPKLKSQFCSENGALNDWMNDDDEDKEEGVMDGVAKSELANDLKAIGENPVVCEITGAITEVGVKSCKNTRKFCIKRFQKMIGSLCGTKPICDKLKSCMAKMIEYVMTVITRRRRRRWLEDLKTRNILSRESLSAESLSLESN